MVSWLGSKTFVFETRPSLVKDLVEHAQWTISTLLVMATMGS